MSEEVNVEAELVTATSLPGEEDGEAQEYVEAPEALEVAPGWSRRVSERVALRRNRSDLITSLSHAPSPSKWSFGKGPARGPAAIKLASEPDPRPPWQSPQKKKKSEPGVAPRSSPPDPATPESEYFPIENSKMSCSSSAGALFERSLSATSSSWIADYPTPQAGHDNHVKAARFDGSFERLKDAQPRLGFPKAKQYDPAKTVGTVTPALQQAPLYSFGGGPTRVPPASSEISTAAPPSRAGSSAASTQSQPAVSKNTSKRHSSTIAKRAAARAYEEADVEWARAAEILQKPSRGFGTAKRFLANGSPFVHKGSATAPGPAAYVVPRLGDPVSTYTPSSILPWGHRTTQRPEWDLPSASDLGPDYETRSAFDQSAPRIAHPVNEPAPQGPGPGYYEVDVGPHKQGGRDLSNSWSIGDASRSDIVRANTGYSGGSAANAPGVGTYNAHKNGNPMWRSIPEIGMGKSVRLHQCDLVDPLDPPGPGSHEPREMLVKEDRAVSSFKCKEARPPFHGMGPKTPASCTYEIGRPEYNAISPQKTWSTQKRSISMPLETKVRETPGPATYEPPHITKVKDRSPEWGSVGRTAPRKPPWNVQMLSQELSKSPHDPPRLVVGPRWTAAPRRKTWADMKKTVADNHSATLSGPFTSIGG